MPTPELAKQASTVRADLARLEADLKLLLDTIGGAVGSAVRRRLDAPLASLSSDLDPLLTMLGASSLPTQLSPEVKKSESDAAKPRGRRGGRRTKANLTPAAIADALKQTRGNKSAAARVLGVSQPTFFKYLKLGK